MFQRRTRRISDEEARQLGELASAEGLAPIALRDFTFALVAAAAVVAFWLWLRREPERWIVLAGALYAGAVMIGKATPKWIRHIHDLRNIKRIVHEGQVIEEVIESGRVAVAAYQKYAAPAVGAREQAGYFYDLGDGTFFYWWADWDHTAAEPEFPRHRLQIVWDLQRQHVLWVHSSGDLLKPERVLSRERLHHLPSGSVIPADIETLEEEIERYKIVAKTMQ
jgi:hypothetical protein